MFDAGAIVSRMKLDKEQWDSSVQDVKRDSGELQGEMQKTTADIVKMSAALTAAGAVALGFFGKMMKIAAEEERIYFMLQSQLETLGFAYNGVMKDIREFTSATQAASTAGDEQVAQIMMKLLPYVKSLDDAYVGTTLALDLAAQGMFNAETAARYMGMAMAGNVEILGRYIVELRSSENEMLKTMTTSEKAAYAMEILRGKFEGLAEKEAKTLTGSMKSLNNSIGDISESMGRKLVPDLAKVARGMTAVVDKVVELTEQFQTLGSAVMVTVGAFGALATSLGALGLLKMLVVKALGAISIAIGALLIKVAAVAVVVGLVYAAFKKWDEVKAFLWSFVEGVNRALEEVMVTVREWIQRMADIPFVGKYFEGALDAMNTAVDFYAENAEYAAERAEEALLNSIPDPPKVKEKIEEAIKGIGEAFSKMNDEIRAGMKSAWDGIVEDMSDFTSFASDMTRNFFGQFESTFSDVLYNVFTGQFESIKEAFASFGDTLIRMVMDLVARIIMYFAIIKPLVGMFPGLAPALGVPTAQSGSEGVPHTGLYQLHAGEKVTPRYDATKEDSQEIVIHNIITPEAIALAMSGREGKNVIVNAINEDSLRNGVTREVIRR